MVCQPKILRKSIGLEASYVGQAHRSHIVLLAPMVDLVMNNKCTPHIAFGIYNHSRHSHRLSSCDISDNQKDYRVRWSSRAGEDGVLCHTERSSTVDIYRQFPSGANSGGSRVDRALYCARILVRESCGRSAKWLPTP